MTLKYARINDLITAIKFISCRTSAVSSGSSNLYTVTLSAQPTEIVRQQRVFLFIYFLQDESFHDPRGHVPIRTRM